MRLSVTDDDVYTASSAYRASTSTSTSTTTTTASGRLRLRLIRLILRRLRLRPRRRRRLRLPLRLRLRLRRLRQRGRLPLRLRLRRPLLGLLRLPTTTGAATMTGQQGSSGGVCAREDGAHGCPQRHRVHALHARAEPAGRPIAALKPRFLNSLN